MTENNDVYVDIVDQLQHTLIVEEHTKETRAVLVEAMREIESLRNALTMFSEEFENIQKMDEQREVAG
jgi:hypothetical protein